MCFAHFPILRLKTDVNKLYMNLNDNPKDRQIKQLVYICALRMTNYKSPHRVSEFALKMIFSAFVLVGLLFQCQFCFAVSGKHASEVDLPVVITAGSDHLIKSWDSAGTLKKVIGSHEEGVTTLLLNDGSLISASRDGALKVWNLTTGDVKILEKDHKGGITALTLSPDKSILAVGGGDGYISVWNLGTGKRLSDFPKAHGGEVRCLQYTSDASLLISGSADRMIRIWRLNGNGLEYQSNIVGHDEAVTGVFVGPDNKSITSVSEDGFLKSWNMKGGALDKRIKTGAGILCASLSPDGHTLATGDSDGKIKLWNFATGAPILFTGSHDRGVTALAWTSDGKMIVSGGADKTLRYWIVATSREVAKTTAHDGTVEAIVILP